MLRNCVRCGEVMTRQGVAGLPGIDRPGSFQVDIYQCPDSQCRTVELASHEQVPDAVV